MTVIDSTWRVCDCEECDCVERMPPAEAELHEGVCSDCDGGEHSYYEPDAEDGDE